MSKKAAGLPLFIKLYCRKQYAEAYTATKFSFMALVGFRKPRGGNPMLVFDHGLVWQILRDMTVVGTTLVRIVFGFIVLVGMTVTIPTLFLVRLICIPLYAMIKWFAIERRVRKVTRGQL